MKRILFILIASFATTVQNIHAQNYPPGSWVRPVTPQTVPRQAQRETYEEMMARTGQCNPSDARLYEAFAVINSSGTQTNIPDIDRINSNLKYIGQVGQYITTFEYPLKNLPLRYKYAGKNNSGNSVYYMASRDMLNGNEFINKSAYIIVFTSGNIGIGGENMDMMYFKASSEAQLQQRLNKRASYDFNSNNSSSSSYYGGNTYDNSNSYGGNSSNSTTKRQTTTRNCPYCHGTGTCNRCHGSGWYQVSHTSNNKARCGCGNGQCRYCNGTGRR